MIYLNQNTSNTIILELTSVSALLNPYYVFNFNNDLYPDQNTTFTANDQSNFKCRYNLFTITLTGASNTNLLNGTLNLNGGQYTYDIYETPISGSTVITGLTSISTGKVVVNGGNPSLNSIYL